MKIAGWVLAVVGLVGLWYSYSSGYGWTGYIVSLVIAGVGLWMAMKEDAGGATM